ncbi:transcriptional regulator family: Fungal Specific TF [Penicillium capsulatum]|uniref:Transcriptional regulator family: Fungal Specific TF n=1 Tax=Penicillium capsulatum TaxID=69766 RepID=A0A9W9LGI3_9EURO|nr:transcriptional regulator family: Fungal Specific TF [Penicillium capsulatum]KAJ6105413.1 transcriptional regulator family: Fungal Specific TF [Penicillium capsulatum]
MPPETRFSRSRTGCLQCRKKHYKCDEKRPACSFCSLRRLNCQWPSGIKWFQPKEPVSSQRDRRTVRCVDNALSSRLPSLLGDHPFDSEEAKCAWEYYVQLVSSNVPALDGPDNPYRQLSFAALSSPVLLETIVCIATEHMLNFGLGSIPTAAQRQQRMLRTIGQNLRMVDAGAARETGRVASAHVPEYEALLIAVVLQGVVVAQSEDGVLEPHIRCAAYLMESLDLFDQIPHSPLTRMAVQRFAMVDVMLAFSRQRRPYAPRRFVLYKPDADRWDGTEPSFHKMTGCPQPLMCLFARIVHLARDTEERLGCAASINDLLSEAYRLEDDLRAWGVRYTRMDPTGCVRPPLDVLSECFYWTAHLLLARRVFRDPTRCPRVQHLTHTCFVLMDQLFTGCGPDSSLPQPFYLAAREAVTVEDRAWVQQKHASMTAYYREQQRNLAMRLTERVWEVTDELPSVDNVPALSPGSAMSSADEQIQTLDRQARLFIF